MTTRAKIAIGVLAGLIILIGGALGTLWSTFDPAVYRHEINTAVSRAIGRPVRIEGAIRLSVFPWPGVRFHEIEMANAPGFDERPIARIRSAKVSLRVLPLIYGQIRMGTLRLHGVDLRLARHANGNNNWHALVHSLSAALSSNAGAVHHAKSTVDHAAELPVDALRVDALEISDAHIHYDDDLKDRHYRLDQAGLETGRITNNSPFRLEADGDLSWPGSNLTAAIHLVSRIEPNVEDQFYRFSGLSLNILADGQAVPGNKQEANISASGDIDLEAGRFTLDGVSLQSTGLTVTGDIDGSGLNDTPSYNGRITVDEFSPRAVVQQLRLHVPQTQSSSAWSDAGFDAQFEGGAGHVSFKQINARLDDSTLTGTVAIHDFKRPRYTCDLNLDTLDIDGYFPPGSAEQAQTSQPAETGGGAAQQAAEFDLGPLRYLRMDGRLSIGSLTAARLNIQNAAIALSAADNLLRVDPLTADLYGGRLRLSGRLDAGRPRPEYRLKGRFEAIDLSPMLGDAVSSQRLSGTGAAQIDLHARGKQVARLKRSVGGRVSFEIRDGAINEFDLADVLADRYDIQDNAATNHRATPVQRLEARLTVHDGTAHSQSLILRTPRFVARGQGRYSVPSNQLDYRLDVVPRRVNDPAREDRVNHGSHIQLSGPLLDPDYRIIESTDRRMTSPKP